MNTKGMLSVVVFVLGGWVTSYGQEIEQPEVPGDHFSLEGALELFKKSESPEEFERMLNSPDSKVNNLDLNGDGYIDYIRVIDRYEGNVHAFILQAVISKSESQDVAVIELEKLANGKAILQIIGDEAVYGVETIIEPTREVRTYAGATSTRTVVNVWAWPSVQYVYGPYYHVWISPWAWHSHPRWWRPWRPVTYVHYYSYWRPYRPYYSVCSTYRVAYAHHRVYRPYRTTSVFVHNRHRDQISRYRSTRHDGDRYRNSRTDDARLYSRDDRSSNDDFSRRSSDSGANTDRTSLRDRGVSGNQREYTAPRPNETSRRSVTSPGTREIRKTTASPANRTRTYESPEIQRRPVTRERSTTTTPHRNPAPVKQYEESSRRSVTPPARQEIRRETNPNRTRSYEPPRRSDHVQSSPSPQRPSSQPTRSTTVQRSTPSGDNTPRRSSAPGPSRTIDTKRGRQ